MQLLWRRIPAEEGLSSLMQALEFALNPGALLAAVVEDKVEYCVERY
jgi:hypothetical protein